ncbi:MAG: branched-chain amino acid ABC transporter permease [Deltaproteobacteria bacterium]|nr:branched-chain amino acid ABC transporter permease [Deltaproteobacteria bacterium]
MNDVTVFGIKACWKWVVVIAIFWTFHLLVSDRLNPYIFDIIIYAGINIILAVSLNLVNGFTGQFSMGHAGFMSIGGYLSAYLTMLVFNLFPGIDTQSIYGTLFFLSALFCGGLGAAVSGYLVGLPSLRLKGDYLAIITLGFGEIIRVIILNIETIGGARGLPGIPALSHFGWVYTFVVLSIFTVWRLMQSPHGRAFLSVREDEVAAEAMGVNTTKTKVRAFALGAFFAGIAGGLFAHYLLYLNPQGFDFNKSFEIIIMVVLGGMGSISGSVIAAVFLTAIREALRELQQFTQIDFRMVIYSLMLIILMLTRPNGLFGTKEIFHFIPLRRRSLHDVKA